jgi:uncharacterized membrane protein
MNFTKKNVLISIVIFIIALFVQSIKSGSIGWVEASNITFTLAGILLIIGLSGLIFASGSFDFFHYSMRKAFRKTKKGSEHEASLNPNALSASVGKSYRNVLTIGVILLIISILCLWDYIL